MCWCMQVKGCKLGRSTGNRGNLVYLSGGVESAVLAKPCVSVSPWRMRFIRLLLPSLVAKMKRVSFGQENQ